MIGCVSKHETCFNVLPSSRTYSYPLEVSENCKAKVLDFGTKANRRPIQVKGESVFPRTFA